MMKSISTLLWAMASACTLAIGLLHAAVDDKPFAEHKVVLQISDSDPAKQGLVLNVANNLLKAYGVDKVDVEIVAFGPGLSLLLAGNANGARLDGLAGGGVRFAACQNTLNAMAKEQGKEPALNRHVTKVGAGVVRIIELTGQDYTLIRP